MKKYKIRLNKLYSKIALLLIIVLLVLLAFKILSNGIRINNISIAGINVDGLYLKLNKKLILEIDNINLGSFGGSADSTPSISQAASIVRRAIWLTSAFEYLEISNIQYQSESSSVFFNGTQYEVHTPFLIAKFALENHDNDIILDIETLRLKRESLDIKGQVLYMKRNDIFAFDVVSYINDRVDNTINFQGETNFKHLNVVLESTTLNSIDILAPYIKILDSDVYEWIYERSAFDKVTIERAYLTIDKIKSKSEDIQQQVIDNLYASGIVENVSLTFDENLAPVHTAQVAVSFENGKLIFKTNNANFEGVIAQNARVDISRFLDRQPLLELHISAQNAALDSRILGILENYDISLPLLQKSGGGDGYINLAILLPTGNYPAQVTPNGFFALKESDVAVNGVDIFVNRANITISEDSVLIDNANAQFGEILDTDITIDISTTEKFINLTAIPRFFKVASQDTEIFNFTGENIRATIDFSGDSIKANLADFGVEILANNYTKITAHNLALIAAHSPILTKLDLTQGSAQVSFKDTSDIILNTHLTGLKYPIYTKDGEPITQLYINGAIMGDSIILQDSAQRLKSTIAISGGKVALELSDMLININEFLASQIPILKDKSADSAINGDSVSLSGKNLILSLWGHKMGFEAANLLMTKSGFRANGTNKNGVANLVYNSGILNIEAYNFDEGFINQLADKDIVSGGTFGLIGIYKDEKFLGEITMANTSIKDMASLQNLITLIDTIPSLVVFKLPGFSTSGYEVEDGRIRVGANSEFVALENIYINGSSVDIEGQGVITLENKELNINLSLSTMKSLSSILNKIPIIGYLLLGDDGKITTEIAITGTLDNPQTDLSLLEDTAQAPVNIIKRALTPFQMLIEELEKESRQKGHR